MHYSNFDQVLKELRGINQDVEDIRQEIASVSGVSYASQDARQATLDGLQCDIGA